jgi:uncharacterized membrane protein YedE/YeeE
MTANCESREQYGMDQAEMKYWARRGAKTGAFLLVIPGSAIIGLGIGLLTGHSIPSTVIGFGSGLLLWGLIVALTK